MAVSTSSPFALGHEFKAREARDHLKDVLDRAEGGSVSVIRRQSPVVAIDRDTLGQMLAPIAVMSSVTSGQFAFWVDGVPIHAVGDDLEAAEGAFIDALIDYAEAWFDDLRRAPNHEHLRDLAYLIAIYAGDPPALRQVIFGDD